MAATVKVIQHMEVQIGNDLKEMGSRTVPDEAAITGEVFEVKKSLASAASPNEFPLQELWASGDGGIDTFDILCFEADADCLIELKAGADIALLNVAGGVPLILSTDELLGSSVATDSEATMDLIDTVSMKNNEADGTTIVGHLILLA